MIISSRLQRPRPLTVYQVVVLLGKPSGVESPLTVYQVVDLLRKVSKAQRSAGREGSGFHISFRTPLSFAGTQRRVRARLRDGNPRSLSLN